MKPEFRRLLVYIAGPYRAETEGGILDNILRAEALAHELLTIGFSVYCPHKNTAWFTEAHCRYGALSPEACLENDIVILNRCDALLMVPGWENSRGAVQERVYAEKADMPVFESIAELVDYAGSI